MSNVFSLDSLREEADRLYKPLSVTLSDGTEATLQNLFRLNKKSRTSILEAVEAIGADETSVTDLINHIETIIKGVSTHSAQLLKELDGDVAVSLKLIERWMEGTQLPEAGNSPDSSTSTASN